MATKKGPANDPRKPDGIRGVKRKPKKPKNKGGK